MQDSGRTETGDTSRTSRPGSGDPWGQAQSSDGASWERGGRTPPTDRVASWFSCGVFVFQAQGPRLPPGDPQHKNVPPLTVENTLIPDTSLEGSRESPWLTLVTSAWPQFRPAITALPALEGPILASGSSRPLLFSLALASGQTGSEAIAGRRHRGASCAGGGALANPGLPGLRLAAAMGKQLTSWVAPRCWGQECHSPAAHNLRPLHTLQSHPIPSGQSSDTCSRDRGQEPGALCTWTSRTQMCLTPGSRDWVGGGELRVAPGHGGPWSREQQPSAPSSEPRTCPLGLIPDLHPAHGPLPLCLFL